MKKIIPPTVTKEGDTTVETHPSYGLVSLSQYTCSPPQNFFGSSLRHHSGISLRIKLAEKHRNLSSNWYHDRGEIIEINMTASQFTDLITSMNMGDGVPCTINHVNAALAAEFPQGEVVYCPEINERQHIEAEFKQDMEEIARKIDDLVAKAEELQKKPSVNKSDRQEFVNIATVIRNKISNCLPFVQSQFNEAVDDTLSDAKADLQSFTAQIAQALGGEALAKQLAAASSQSSAKMIENLQLQQPNETDV